MAREPAMNLPNPWAAVGRDTEAGRALFALYNGYGHARSRGNDYSQINKMKTLKHIATHGLPEFPVLQPPPPKKPEVKVPHFPHRNYDPDEFHPIDFIPRRRRASEILQQIRDDSYVVELPPMPKGPLLDEAEKARLQEVFYWSNRNLGPEPPVAEPLRRLPKKGSVAEQELLLNTIATEIEDREAFLTEMEAYGKGEQYRSQIMFEIQQRVGQMKLLHDNITQQEKKENENRQSVIKTEKFTPQISYTAPPKNLYARGQGRNANTTTLRYNPFISTLPELNEDPRFLEKSSNVTRQTASSGTSKWKTRIDTQNSATPNVIATAACYATTPDDAATTSMADSQRKPELNEDPRFLEKSSNFTRQTASSSTNTWRTYIETPNPATPNVIATAACYATTPDDDAATPSMADSQAPTTPSSTKFPTKTPKYSNSNSNLNLHLHLDFPQKFRRHSSNGSPVARSPLHFQSGGNSEYMSGATSNLNANSPPRSVAWNNCCSPVGEICSRADFPRDLLYYNDDDGDDEQQYYRPDYSGSASGCS